jgi:hypothetical protein
MKIVAQENKNSEYKPHPDKKIADFSSGHGRQPYHAQRQDKID